MTAFGRHHITQNTTNVSPYKHISITVAWDALRLGLGVESTIRQHLADMTHNAGHDKHIPVITVACDALRLGLGEEVTNLVFYAQSTITVTSVRGGRRVENQRWLIAFDRHQACNAGCSRHLPGITVAWDLRVNRRMYLSWSLRTLYVTCMSGECYCRGLGSVIMFVLSTN